MGDGDGRGGCCGEVWVVVRGEEGDGEVWMVARGEEGDGEVWMVVRGEEVPADAACQIKLNRGLIF